MDFIWILLAFLFGFGFKLLSLPPLIGYLVAGFILHAFGMTPDGNLQVLADLGITLLLFTIGLKLNIKELLKQEVWMSTLIHMSSWTLVATAIFSVLASVLLASFASLPWQHIALIAFALSFSSTVCIVKILEESGELKTRHGKLSIGILVMQDIVAVIFLVIATGKIPSLWATALLALPLIQPAISKIIERSGHGELIPLTGFFLALGGYELFELVGMKGDLGALVVGFLLAGHPKSTELYKSLMSFKDLFLIGFFLSIGFSALPNWEMAMLALLLCLLLPVKSLLFFLLMTKLNLRGRTSFLSSLVLTNYSEFGLIVIALCVSSGWLSNEWLVIIALAVSFSFVFTSIAYRSAHVFYANNKEAIKRLESPYILPVDRVKQPVGAEILVIGMGRVGKATYNSLVKVTQTNEISSDKIFGMDADKERINRLQSNNYNVFVGDGEDADLWEQLDLTNVKLILVALPYIQDIKNIMRQLKIINFQGKVVAIARYEDQVDTLKKAGLDKIYNIYNEAGIGFAEESLGLITSAKCESSA